jgi:hypothetical protein
MRKGQESVSISQGDIIVSSMIFLLPKTFKLFGFQTFGFLTRLTRRVPLVEQELLTFPEHLSSPSVFSGVRVTRSLVLCVCFVDRCLSILAIVLCVLFRYTDSDYPLAAKAEDKLEAHHDLLKILVQ